MTWVRTEDAMPLHPKILRLSDGAFRLWSNALHFANRSVSDGKIPKELIASLNHHGRWSPKQLAGFVSELLTDLWIDRGDHYEIHDYAHHQAEALKNRVERKRELDRARQQKKREREEEAARASLGLSRRDTTRDSSRDDHRESLRETSVPARPGPISLTTFESDTHGTGPIVGGIDPETVRLAYVERWEKHAPGKRPPMVARGFGGAVWTEMARAFVDSETTEQILDAAFADPFVRSTGWTPNAILGSMARLSTVDVRREAPQEPAERVTAGNPALERFEAAKRLLDACKDPEQKGALLRDFYDAQRELARARVRGAA